MSGAIMNKVWDLFGMDNAEDKQLIDILNKYLKEQDGHLC